MKPEEIKQIRLAAGLTQEALAAKVGVTASTVYRWEKGRKKPQGPARKMLKQLEGGK